MWSLVLFKTFVLFNGVHVFVSYYIIIERGADKVSIVQRAGCNPIDMWPSSVIPPFPRR